MISVIVPVYNVDRYLKYCIESIMNQTYKNIEIILINDGSEDNSLEICKKYSKLDSRIRVINKQNGGLSSARNAGLSTAKGEYISFVDSDDSIEKDFLENLYNNIKKHDADICQCDFKKVYNLDDISDRDFDINYKVELINKYQALDNLYNKNYLKTVVFWNKLYKKKIFDELKFKENIINEDEELMYKVLYNINKFINIDIQLYNYYIRQDSIMGNGVRKVNLDIVKIMEDRISFFENKNEIELKEKTIAIYSRILLDLATKVSSSNLTDKEDIMKIIENKIDINKEIFRRNKYKSSLCKMLIFIYGINKNLCFYINKNIFDLKKTLKKDR